MRDRPSSRRVKPNGHSDLNSIPLMTHAHTFTRLSPRDKEEFSQRDVHDLTQGEAFGPTVLGVLTSKTLKPLGGQLSPFVVSKLQITSAALLAAPQT